MNDNLGHVYMNGLALLLKRSVMHANGLRDGQTVDERKGLALITNTPPRPLRCCICG